MGWYTDAKKKIKGAFTGNPYYEGVKAAIVATFAESVEPAFRAAALGLPESVVACLLGVDQHDATAFHASDKTFGTNHLGRMLEERAVSCGLSADAADELNRRLRAVMKDGATPAELDWSVLDASQGKSKAQVKAKASASGKAYAQTYTFGDDVPALAQVRSATQWWEDVEPWQWAAGAVVVLGGAYVGGKLLRKLVA